MRPEGFTVFIVEDDSSIRDALALLLGLNDYAVAMFADAESFLRAHDASWNGCLLLDIRMPGMNGLELQARLRESGCLLPVIVMTGHGDLESARQAFRADAVDFLEKPLNHERLLNALTEARQRQSQRRDQSDRRDSASARLAVLTRREREVMDLVVAGKHNRDIAVLLGISVRTVEVHKARMMDKLHVEGIPQLIRLTIALKDD